MVLEKTLESPLNSNEIKSVNPKGNQPYSLEGLALKLKLQYFGHLMQRADSLEKTMMLGKTESRAAAERSYPMSEVRGGGRECQAVTAQERPRGATPCLGTTEQLN